MNKIYSLILIAIFFVSILSAPVMASHSSSNRRMINIGGENYLQVRGVDRPHGYTNYTSWPGYTSYVHNNCYHVHGEYKKISSGTGREYYSKSVSIPLYCKGATRFISKAFRYAAGELEISAWKFLKIGGVLTVIITQIPSVGGPYEVCEESNQTNSTYCYWRQ